jgi:hypothetical protein
MLRQSTAVIIMTLYCIFFCFTSETANLNMNPHKASYALRCSVYSAEFHGCEATSTYIMSQQLSHNANFAYT